MWVRRILTIFTVFCLLTVSFIVFPSEKAQALSISDYFVYTYDFSFSKSTITDDETFYVTVSGQAECIQDLPLALNATEAYMESTVIANLAGSEVILNEKYTLSYPDFPSKQGETASASIQVPLSFPANSTSGVYSVTGYLNIARVKVLGIWISVTGYLPSSQSMGALTYQPVMGGGGGSTGSNQIHNLTQFMDESGVFIEDVQVLSTDKIVRLQFSAGTRFTVLGETGNSVSIEAIQEGTEPSTSENNQIVGLVYNIEPEGASFSIPVKISFSYDEESLPYGAQEKDIVIAWWDTENAEWMPLEDCKVDEIANIVAGIVRHFTMFAIMVDTSPPASFDVSSLTIKPLSVKTGESVTITVKAENNGGRTGTLTLILKINGIEEVRRSISLGTDSNRIMDFTVIRDVPGNYKVDINGQTGSFVVELLSSQVTDQTPSETESPSPPETDQTTELQTEAQSESSTVMEIGSAQEVTTREQFAWWQVIASLAAGMVIGGFVLLLMHNKRRT